MTSRPLQPPRPQLQPPSLVHQSSSGRSSSSTTTSISNSTTPFHTHTHRHNNHQTATSSSASTQLYPHNPHLPTPLNLNSSLDPTDGGRGLIKTEPLSSSPSSPSFLRPGSGSSSSGSMEHAGSRAGINPPGLNHLSSLPEDGSSSSGGELGDDYDDEIDDDEQQQQQILLHPPHPGIRMNGMNGTSSASTTTTGWEGHVNQPIQSQPVQHPHQSHQFQSSNQGFVQAGQGHVNPSSLGMSGVGGSRSGSGHGSGSGFGGNRGINVADLHPGGGGGGGGGYVAGSTRNGSGLVHGHGHHTTSGMIQGAGMGMGMMNDPDGSLGVDEDLEAILPPPSASDLGSASASGSGSGSAGVSGRFEPWSQGRMQQGSQFHGNQLQLQQQGNHQGHQQQQQRGGAGQQEQQQMSNQSGRVQNYNGFDEGRAGGHEMLDHQEGMDGFNSTSNLSYPPSQQQQQAPAAPAAGPPGLSSEKARTLELLLVKFWTNQMDLAERGLPPQPQSSTSSGGVGGSNAPQPPVTVQKEEFKNFALPLARIKKVMKSDPEVKMISAEVPVLLGKCCEIFIAELTSRAWLVAQSNKRRTLQKSDVAAAIGYSDMFDFLIDIVPREEVVPAAAAGSKNGESNASAKRKKDDDGDGSGSAKRRREDEEDDE